MVVVRPFTIVAAGFAALPSRLAEGWPGYPKPLKDIR
jgi:hypothetical protein